MSEVAESRPRSLSLAQIWAAATATVCLSSLVLRFVLSGNAMGYGAGAVRYFSYFTILSNILVATVVTPAAFAPHSSLARWVLRPPYAGAVALYIIITGLIFHALLSGLEALVGLDQAANVGLHYLTPPLYALFWLLFVPKGTLRPIHALVWLIWPVVYAAISLIRGPIVAWYPYPFIDASRLAVGRLILNIVGVSAVFLVVGLVLVAIDAVLGRMQAGRAPAV
jgi:hypothetical protein